MTSLIFYLFSGLALTSAVLVIILREPVRALLALVVSMLSLAVLFILLGAFFVAMAHIIVYAGAVLVLFLFVIMLQGLGAKDTPLSGRFQKGYLILASFVSIAFLIIVIFLARGFLFPASQGIEGTVEAIGEALFRNYLLPFELTSFLLLLGVFAAVALAKKEENQV